MSVIECPECHGLKAPCGNLGDNNHCETCRGAGSVDSVAYAAEQLVTTLLKAQTDIHHWVKFAERQMAELQNWDHLPCGPTTAGVAASRSIMTSIAVAIVEYRKASEDLTRVPK